MGTREVIGGFPGVGAKSELVDYPWYVDDGPGSIPFVNEGKDFGAVGD